MFINKYYKTQYRYLQNNVEIWINTGRKFATKEEAMTEISEDLENLDHGFKLHNAKFRVIEVTETVVACSVKIIMKGI